MSNLLALRSSTLMYVSKSVGGSVLSWFLGVILMQYLGIKRDINVQVGWGGHWDKRVSYILL